MIRSENTPVNCLFLDSPCFWTTRSISITIQAQPTLLTGKIQIYFILLLFTKRQDVHTDHRMQGARSRFFSLMASSDILLVPRYYGTNASYIYEYSRGLGGVDVPRDVLFTRIIYASLTVLAFCIFCGRVAQIAHAQLRLLTSLAADKRRQAFWSIESSRLWASVKKHVLYAPLGRKRHNREIQLSSAVNVGTVPSRFQTILITLYIASQVAYCAYLDYNVNVKAALVAELRGRSGTLAVLNMVPLFLLAARNNPLIPLLRISFDTYNLIHRWLGRIIVIESVVHTVAWAVNACDEQNVQHMLQRLRDTPFFTWGLVGTVSMVFLCLHSPSPLRHAFYETFLHLHRLAALAALIGVYVHLDIDSLPQRPWLKAIFCIWPLEHSFRLLRLLYLNIGKHTTKLEVKALAGEACCVTFELPRRVSMPPGCHVYAYIPCVSWWMSHPFSVAWAEDNNNAAETIPHPPKGLDLEKQNFSTYMEEEMQRHFTTSVSLIIAARQGATRRLYDKAMASPDGTFQATGFVEGPYLTGDPTFLSSYGTAVLFAAGAGITHHLLHIKELLVLASSDSAATHQIHLIWSVRTTAHLTWAKDFMNQILQLPNRREILKIRLFVSKPSVNDRLISSPSETVTMIPGRCHPGIILDEILPGRVGATAVSVCGPGSFADEVRAATRERTGRGMVVDFVEEAFSW